VLPIRTANRGPNPTATPANRNRAAGQSCDDRRVTNEEPEPGEPAEHKEPAEPEEHEARSVDRLIFFSDAVTAIAITLLAIDLPVPNGATVSAFWSSVRHNDGEYLAFLVSFLAIAAAWTDHHDAFRHIRRADARLRNLNMIWLLMIILIPSATKLLTDSGQNDLTVHAFRWGFYSLVQVLISAALFAMARHMISHHLQEPGTGQKYGSASDWRSYSPMLGWGLSIPVFFVTTDAWVLWIVVPLLVHRLHRLPRRHQPDPEAT
jgi:uncharacterized membrane protein